MNRPAGIYIHIPFCVRKCNYCDFLSWRAGEKEREEYVGDLVREIGLSDRWFPEIDQVDSVFIGGGTPSILSAGQLQRICEALDRRFSIQEGCEFTMECNPGTAKGHTFAACLNMGINRLSFGVQSSEEAELRLLGRVHSYAEAERSFQEAREAGFQNINIDLMSGIPGQTIESYGRTLDRILHLEPEHISAYSLIIEEGTPFYDRYREEPPVDEETDRQMYMATGVRLSEYGYERYEISNYAKTGFACRHNLKYWSGGEYIGFGVGASSRVGNTRYRNEENPAEYTKRICQERRAADVEEILDRDAQMSEFFFLGLRRTRGVNLTEFERLYGVSAFDIYERQIRKLVEYGLLKQQGSQLYLTEYGLDVSNLVFCEFV
ncbi:MAG: radical SAM family heme chaperone HemW [Eubacterium sp.]|nr:radical SAM family heme chaperone HemW [Eubacterium sp.]